MITTLLSLTVSAWATDTVEDLLLSRDGKQAFSYNPRYLVQQRKQTPPAPGDAIAPVPPSPAVVHTPPQRAEDAEKAEETPPAQAPAVDSEEDIFSIE